LLTLLALIPTLCTVPLFASSAAPSPIPSIFDPYSTPAHAIYHLSLFVLSICAGIFLVVFSLIVYAAVKYRKRPSDDDCEPPQIYGSNQVELAWTVIPILIVVVLCDPRCRRRAISRERNPGNGDGPSVLVGI